MDHVLSCHPPKQILIIRGGGEFARAIRMSIYSGAVDVLALLMPLSRCNASWVLT
jgi:hypothetical protein